MHEQFILLQDQKTKMFYLSLADAFKGHESLKMIKKYVNEKEALSDLVAFSKGEKGPGGAKLTMKDVFVSEQQDSDELEIDPKDVGIEHTLSLSSIADKLMNKGHHVVPASVGNLPRTQAWKVGDLVKIGQKKFKIIEKEGHAFLLDLGGKRYIYSPFIGGLIEL